MPKGGSMVTGDTPAKVVDEIMRLDHTFQCAADFKDPEKGRWWRSADSGAKRSAMTHRHAPALLIDEHFAQKSKASGQAHHQRHHHTAGVQAAVA